MKKFIGLAVVAIASVSWSRRLRARTMLPRSRPRCSWRYSTAARRSASHRHEGRRVRQVHRNTFGHHVDVEADLRSSDRPRHRGAHPQWAQGQGWPGSDSALRYRMHIAGKRHSHCHLGAGLRHDCGQGLRERAHDQERQRRDPRANQEVDVTMLAPARGVSGPTVPYVTTKARWSREPVRRGTAQARRGGSRASWVSKRSFAIPSRRRADAQVALAIWSCAGRLAFGVTPVFPSKIESIERTIVVMARVLLMVSVAVAILLASVRIQRASRYRRISRRDVLHGRPQRRSLVAQRPTGHRLQRAQYRRLLLSLEHGFRTTHARARLLLTTGMEMQAHQPERVHRTVHHQVR